MQLMTIGTTVSVHKEGAIANRQKGIGDWRGRETIKHMQKGRKFCSPCGVSLM